MKETKRANKEYYCNNCVGIINKGTQYKLDIFWQKGTYDAEFDTYSRGKIVHWRTHVNCRLQNI